MIHISCSIHIPSPWALQLGLHSIRYKISICFEIFQMISQRISIYTYTSWNLFKYNSLYGYRLWQSKYVSNNYWRISICLHFLLSCEEHRNHKIKKKDEMKINTKRKLDKRNMNYYWLVVDSITVELRLWQMIINPLTKNCT